MVNPAWNVYSLYPRCFSNFKDTKLLCITPNLAVKPAVDGGSLQDGGEFVGFFDNREINFQQYRMKVGICAALARDGGRCCDMYRRRHLPEQIAAISTKPCSSTLRPSLPLYGILVSASTINAPASSPGGDRNLDIRQQRASGSCSIVGDTGAEREHAQNGGYRRQGCQCGEHQPECIGIGAP